MQEHDVFAGVKRFLASDLSRLVRRYNDRFTDRLSYDGRSFLGNELGKLDHEIKNWRAQNSLGKTIPHVILSQSSRNAKQIFPDPWRVIDRREYSKGDPDPLAHHSEPREHGWLTALFAIRDPFKVLKLVNQ